MKLRLRAKCWWPKLDQEVKKFVSKCFDCALVSAPTNPEPMTRRELPSNAWQDIAIDFLGPLPTTEYLLVIVDYYSRYLEIEVMKKITSEATIERLDRIFTRLGYPRTITLDDAKQFISATFPEYCVNKGIHLNNVSPYWPQANGQVERQNRTLLKRLQIGHQKTGNWKSELNDFLMMYYTTPHTITGKTPTEMLMNRTIRSKVPSIKDLESPLNREEVYERDKMLKGKGKEAMDEKRKAGIKDIQTGDKVLAKNLNKGNKLVPEFNAKTFVVVGREGPNIQIQDQETGVQYSRNVGHVKRAPEQNEEESEDEFYGFEEDELELGLIGEA